jgi:hypothetical protein
VLNKTALVTGSTAGIGLTIVTTLAKKGHRCNRKWPYAAACFAMWNSLFVKRSKGAHEMPVGTAK